PLDPAFGEQLEQLARNNLPSGLVGRPDDLFEGHVRSGLEFLLGSPVIRYGQERRFESRPDGVAVGTFFCLFDAKAYSKGYPIERESMRQFASYIGEFQDRYRPYGTRIRSFLVVSGKFPHREDTLK